MSARNSECPSLHGSICPVCGLNETAFCRLDTWLWSQVPALAVIGVTIIIFAAGVAFGRSLEADSQQAIRALCFDAIVRGGVDAGKGAKR